MGEFLKNISKNMLALILIGGGVILIVASDPPVTVCSHQVKKFEEAEVGNLAPKTGEGFGAETRFDKLIRICKQANNLGGCYELFNSMRDTLRRFRTISLDCHEDWGSSSLVQGFFNKSLETMVLIPWGEKGPESESQRLSWYQGPQMELFCRLQDVYALTYGDNAWAQKRETLLNALPGFAELGRTKAWGLSVLSVSCTRYKSGNY